MPSVPLSVATPALLKVRASTSRATLSSVPLMLLFSLLSGMKLRMSLRTITW